MEENGSKIERLDIASRAVIARNVLHRARFWLFVIAAIGTLLGIISTASQLETLAVRIVAGVAWVLLLLSWLEWRYSFQAFAFSSLGFGIVSFWAGPQAHHIYGWIANISLVVFWSMFAWNLWQFGRPFAVVHTEGWEEERGAASRIYQRLIDCVPESATSLWISTGNFWVGYFDYRLVYFEDYWAVGKFKRDKNDRMLEFRVLAKDAVRETEPSGATLELYIAGKEIRNPQLEPESYQRLMRLAMHSAPA